MSKETLEIPKIHFDSDDKLIITATSSSSKNDFDFYKGKWRVQNKKLKSILSGCTEWTEFSSTQEMYPMLSGMGNIDKYSANFDGKPFEGASLRLFNPITNLWSIYWAHSDKGTLDPPVIGSFENNVGHFFTMKIYMDKKIIVVFSWDLSDKNNPIWSQAFSEDKGQTWERNWYMYFSKIN